MIEKTLKSLRNNNFTLIPVDGDPSGEPESGLSYDGDLDSFIEILKKNKVGNVFYMTSTFEEDDVEGYVVVNTDEEDIRKPYKDFFPEVGKYADKVGEQYQLRLFCKIDGYELSYLVSPEWYDDYAREFITSYDSYKENLDSEIKNAAKARTKKKQKVVDAIQDLIKDDFFIELKTIKAMIAYVRDNIDDAELLTDYDMNFAVSHIFNLLKARGLKK